MRRIHKLHIDCPKCDNSLAYNEEDRDWWCATCKVLYEDEAALYKHKVLDQNEEVDYEDEY